MSAHPSKLSSISTETCTSYRCQEMHRANIAQKNPIYMLAHWALKWKTASYISTLKMTYCCVMDSRQMTVLLSLKVDTSTWCIFPESVPTKIFVPSSTAQNAVIFFSLLQQKPLNT